jgi:Flp pilus assembly protein TadB
MSAAAFLVVSLAAVAAALLVPAPAGSRLEAVLDRAPPGATAAPAGDADGDSTSRAATTPALLLASASGGLGMALVVGGLVGVGMGVAAAVAAVVMLRRLEPRAVRVHRERLAADLPTAVDLLAACLSSGRPPAAALTAVLEAVGGPLAGDLGVVAVRLHLGADPVMVWRDLGCRPGPLAALGRTMARSLDTGAPMADGLRLLATDLRRAHRAAVERKASGVGVRAAAPLGLCFLPAFVLVGIVPSVVSAFTAMSWW